jgi:hypothetical protein
MSFADHDRGIAAGASEEMQRNTRQSFICKCQGSSRAQGGCRHRQSGCESDTGASCVPAVEGARAAVRFRTCQHLCRPVCGALPVDAASRAWEVAAALYFGEVVGAHSAFAKGSCVPLLFTEEFELVIIVALANRRDAWVGTEFLT